MHPIRRPRFHALQRAFHGLLLGGLVGVALMRGASAVRANDLDDLPDLHLAGPTRGEYAVQLLGTQLSHVARAYGHSADQLREMLRRDRSLQVDRRGRLHYLESAVSAANGRSSQLAGAAVATDIALADTFKLHSRPGAHRTIYLDFDGQTLTGTVWNDSYASGGPIQAPPFDLDGNPAFNNTELLRIQGIWKRVAEDYAPFDVDVTTELVSETVLTRSSPSDTDYGVRVLISPLSSYVGNYGGIAYVGVFDQQGDYYKPALVFPEKLGLGEKAIAEAASHEAGHTLGLNHDGTTAGVGYYSGNGFGETGWAPIMGAGYYQNVTQWSKGEYALADNKQDDLAVIQGHGLLPVPDDHGNSAASATYLPSGSSLAATGVIGLNGDRDVFAFVVGTGPVALHVSPATTGPNLDLLIELYDSGGGLLATNNPPGELGASLNLTLTAGTYFLHVRGTGVGDPLVAGYTAYASLGQYLLTGTVVDPSGHVPPVAVADANVVSGSVPLVVNFNGSGSFDPDGSITNHTWTFGDGTAATGATVSHTYATVGAYTARLVVADAEGWTAEDTLDIQVLPPNLAPTASFRATPTNGTAPLVVTFDASASGDPDGTLAGYAWNFGDGVTSTAGPVVAHTYTRGGSYTATLVVTDNRGATATQSIGLTVAAAPTTSIRVQAITLTASRNSQGTAVTVAVKVTKTSGAAVSGVVVTGAWSGMLSGSVAITTDAKGVASLTTKRAKKTGTATFTVTGLSKSGCTYVPSQNLVTTASLATARAP